MPTPLNRRASTLRVASLTILMIASVFSSSCDKGRSSDLISGRITTLKDGESRPIAQAQVSIVPSSVDPEKKGADEQPEDPINLTGVALTNDTGFFEITSLSSSATFQEYSLLRNWKYEIQIRVPGYYIYKGPFSYEKGGVELAIELEQKGADVVDDSGVILIDPKAIQSGAIRRGN